MPPNRSNLGSLHPLLQSGAALTATMVRPKGFKALLRSTAAFLEAHQITATVLAKVPKGPLWGADLTHYHQAMAGRSRLYFFERSPTAEPPTDFTARLPLSSPQDWRGEYFVLVLGAAFSGLILARRTAPLTAAPEPDDTVEATDADFAGGQSDRAVRLEIYCSVRAAVMTPVLAALRQQVERCAQQQPDNEAVATLLTSWQQHCPSPSTDSPLLDAWIGWQLQQQEQLRQSLSGYRKQALTASSLTSQNEQLLNTLRLKDDFLNTVGQELRTPLTTIKTALTLLASPALKPPQRQRYMEMISRECDRQSALISGVLNLLQIETSLDQIKSQALSVAQVVPPVVSTYQPLAEERGILLAYTIASDLPPVSCPETWLRQVIIQLLNNSIRFTPAGGQVWVTAQAQSEGVELEIRDTGVGISASDLPRVFDHFYRGRNQPAEAAEGAGLGLAVVQQLLSYCGGSVVASSQPGNGSRFRVRLPSWPG